MWLTISINYPILGLAQVHTHPTLVVPYTSLLFKAYFPTSRPTQDSPFFILHEMLSYSKYIQEKHFHWITLYYFTTRLSSHLTRTKRTPTFPQASDFLAVTWRYPLVRQAVHQTWKNPGSITAHHIFLRMLRFLSNILLIYIPIHSHIDPCVILPSIYTTFSLTISTPTGLIARSPLPPNLTLFHYLYRSFKPKINKMPPPLSYNYQSPPFSPIRNLPESTELQNRVNRLASPGGNSSPPGIS